MTLLTRVKTVVGIIVVAVVAAYAMHLNPEAFKVNIGGDDDNYVLSVTWAPVSMKHHNKIVVLVDGYPLISHNRNVSPWGRTMTAAKGVSVVLTAELHMPTLQMMDCMIMRNGKSVPNTGFHKINGPGTVRCTA
jgi:hypothetical protein